MVNIKYMVWKNICLVLECWWFLRKIDDECCYEDIDFLGLDVDGEFGEVVVWGRKWCVFLIIISDDEFEYNMMNF